MELKKEAQQIGIDGSYVDELLKDQSLKAEDGILFFYYQNSSAFVLQWALMNIAFLVILATLTLIEYEGMSLLLLTTKTLSFLGTNVSIILLITIANGWVFSKKPESLTIAYWILPCILYWSCIAWSLSFIYNVKNVIEIHR